MMATVSVPTPSTYLGKIANKHWIIAKWKQDVNIVLDIHQASNQYIQARASYLRFYRLHHIRHDYSNIPDGSSHANLIPKTARGNDRKQSKKAIH